MNKRIPPAVTGLLILVLALTLGSRPASAADPIVANLVASDSTVVGTVTFERVGGDLVVSFDVTDPGWCMTGTQVHVGNAPPDPDPANWDLSHVLPDCETTDQYVVPVTDDCLVLAAHADLRTKHPVDQVGDLGGLEDDLPADPVDFRVANPGPGNQSYLTITLYDTAVLDGPYEGWCIDAAGHVDGATLYSARLVSSYDPDIAALIAGVVDYPENLDLFNWILNQHFVGMASPCCGTYTYGDVQRAAWELLDAQTATGGLGAWDQHRVDEIVAAALANGDGFEPGCGDVAAVILLPDPITAFQITNLVLPVPCLPVYENDSAWAKACVDHPLANGGSYFYSCDCEEPPACGPCSGKVTELTLRYDGAAPSQVKVVQKNKAVIFDEEVDPGQLFSFVGTDKGTLGTEIKIYVDGREHVRIHTSCSQPIGIGQVAGDFTIMAGASKGGGALCPLGGGGGGDPPTSDCGACKGKVTTLTLRYDGADPALVRVVQNKGEIFAEQPVAPGTSFSIVGIDRGTLGTEIVIYVGGLEHVRIHTSCSQPIGIGMVFGDFTIVDGYSKDGGKLCPMTGGSGSTGGGDPPATDCGACNGKVTTLTLRYDGAGQAQVRVVQNKGEIFNALVAPAESFSFVGIDKGTLGNEIKIFVNELEHVRIHTSCSQPIGIGMVFGDFTIVDGASKKGGKLCPVP